MGTTVFPSRHGMPHGAAGWRDGVVRVLSEAKGALALSLIASVTLSLTGYGHGWQQWLSLLGVPGWVALRKTHLL